MTAAVPSSTGLQPFGGSSSGRPPDSMEMPLVRARNSPCGNAPTTGGHQPQVNSIHPRGTSEAALAALSSFLRSEPDNVPAAHPRPQPHLRGLRPLHTLRALPQRLSHLPPLEPRSRFATRPHPSNDSCRIGPATHHGFLRRPHRQMSRLPRLRNRLPVRGRIWKTRRTRPRAHRARLSPLLARSRHAQLRFPALAPRSTPHHRRRPRSAFLSTLRPAGHRAQHRCSETPGPRRARTPSPAYRRRFFLPPPGLDVSRLRPEIG